jgi:glycosyltransferase involved in cell wall biosynthesis
MFYLTIIKKMTKPLIIIPAFNEEEAIEMVIDDLKNTFADQADILVINDGSIDKTSLVAKKSGAEVINLLFNEGAGAAAQTGYIYAKEKGYNIAAQIDADGQHRGKDLLKLINLVKNENIDLAIGSRYLAKSEYQSSFLRRTGTSLFKNLIFFLSKNKIHDTTSGLRAMSKRTIYEFARVHDPDYAEIESIQRVIDLGYTIKEEPAEMKERQGGVSSINYQKAVSYMVKNTIVLLVGYLRNEGKHANRD